jgi:UDP-2,3-diacylglucosamine pyrophosphatase LpxH
MEHAFTLFPDNTIQADTQSDNPANGITIQRNLHGDIRDGPLPAYVIEQDGDDTCEKNKQEQYIRGYERKKKLAVAADALEVFNLSDGDGSGESWKAYLFPLAPTEGSGKIDDVTVTYLSNGNDIDTNVIVFIAVGDRAFYPKPKFPYFRRTPQFIEYSFTWSANPNTERSWSWYDISILRIGIVVKDDGTKAIQPPLPHELYATVTFKNLFLGNDDENNIYDLGLRFNLVGASRIKNFTYARLILPTSEFHLAEQDQLRLRISGQDVAEASDFSSERPSQKQPVTSNYTDWTIYRDALPDDMSGVHNTQAILTSPDMAPVINEIARNAPWDRDSYSRNIAITVVCNNIASSIHNLIYLSDYEAGLLYNPLALELYKTVYDCFISKEAVARITDTSALIHCISLLSLDFYVEYKAARTYRWHATPLLTDTTPAEPIEVTLGELSPATEYRYRIVYRKAGSNAFSRGQVHSFRTQRAEGEEFTFTIETDTHVRYSEETLAWTESTAQLQLKDLSWDTIESDNADFHINLGDWFEGRAGHCINEATAVHDYIKTKAYQGTRCWPAYFALGNHEGENPTQDKFYANARGARMKVLPNPDASVSSFYKNPNPYESYYAWEWGDALFIVLDPYSYCTSDPDEDPWNWTLGKTQYDWLYDTLSGSQKKWKFVFLHQLTGGKREVRNYGRGGIEYAKYKVMQNATYEWGGEDEKGDYLWSEKRPGWGHGAIHDMLVSEGVTAVFHGHDHGFAHQVLDDIHYIECPVISGIGMFQLLYDSGFLEAADYENGVIMGNNGYIRVTVNPEKVLLEYVGTIREVDEKKQGYKNGTIRYAATLESTGN